MLRPRVRAERVPSGATALMLQANEQAHPLLATPASQPIATRGQPFPSWGREIPPGSSLGTLLPP